MFHYYYNHFYYSQVLYQFELSRYKFFSPPQIEFWSLVPISVRFFELSQFEFLASHKGWLPTRDHGFCWMKTIVGVKKKKRFFGPIFLILKAISELVPFPYYQQENYPIFNLIIRLWYSQNFPYDFTCPGCIAGRIFYMVWVIIYWSDFFSKGRVQKKNPANYPQKVDNLPGFFFTLP